MSKVHRVRRATALGAAVLGLWLGHTEPARSEDEAVGFGADEFTSSACEWVDAVDLNHSAEWAETLRDVFAAEGFAQATQWIDGGLDGRDWTDPSQATDEYDQFGGDDDDNHGADHADVALLVTHGGHEHDYPGGYYSEFLMGDDGEGADNYLSCVPNTRDHFLLGNGGSHDLEIAIIASCQGAHHDVWEDGGYFQVRQRDGSFNTWLGFHGNSHDSSSDANRFEDYLEDSFSNGLGDNWLDELYHNPWGPDDEQCPTAIVFCEDERDCDTQFDWGGFEDRFKVGTSDSKTLSKIFYLGGCDPGAGPALPN